MIKYLQDGGFWELAYMTVYLLALVLIAMSLVFVIYRIGEEIREWRRPLTNEEEFIKRRIEQLRGE
jgi:predicted PurR-regulated permease PerM